MDVNAIYTNAAATVAAQQQTLQAGTFVATPTPNPKFANRCSDSASQPDPSATNACSVADHQTCQLETVVNRL